MGDVGVSPAVKMLKEVRSPGRTIDATGDASISPAHKEVWSPGRTIDATEDAGVSPADVLVQNEVFCVIFFTIVSRSHTKKLPNLTC